MLFWSVKNYIAQGLYKYHHLHLLLLPKLFVHAAICPFARPCMHSVGCSGVIAFEGCVRRQSGTMPWNEGLQPVRHSPQNYSRDRLSPAAEIALKTVCPLCPPSPRPSFPLVAGSSVLLETGREDVDVSVWSVLVHFKVSVWIRAVCALFIHLTI